MGFDVVLVQVNLSRLNDDMSPGRHGLTGVHGQVHDRLLDLVRISLDVADAVRQIEGQLNILAQQAAELFSVWATTVLTLIRRGWINWRRLKANY